MGGKSSKASSEEFGNSSTATHEVRIQYCGGWGYRKHASAAKDIIVEALGENAFIVFNKDSGITGNLNVTVGKKGTKNFTLVHSKKNGDGLVSDANKDEFINKLKSVMK